MPRIDPYKVIGVEKTATQDEIKKAYRKLASKHHPDKGGDKEKFQEIQDAYDIIINAPEESEPEVSFDDFLNRYGWKVRGHYNGGYSGHQKPPAIYMATITLQDAYKGGVVNFQAGSVAYPAGIRPGTKMRTQDGDFVEFDVKSHPVIKRSMDDLLIEYTINAIEAMAGTTVEFTHLDGKTYRVKVRPGVQQGELTKMSSFGMKNPEFDTTGDLYLSANIIIPKDMDESVIETLKGMKWYNSKIMLDTKV